MLYYNLKMENKFGYKKIFFTLFIFLIVGMGGMLLLFVENIENYRSAKISDTINDAVREEMDRQNKQNTALAIAIAGNETLASALKKRDRAQASRALDAIMASFAGYKDGSKFWLQLHTPDLKVFMRSWDKSEYGAPLESFRKGLVYVRKTQMPFSSIELGKKLNIKSIAPIKLNGEYVGSLEVIKNFDEAVKNFADKKISLLVLMDNKFLNVAEWMVDYPILGDFIVCHREYDEKLVNELKEDDLYLFIGRKKSFSKSYFVSIEPLRDLSGERLGFFVAAIPKKMASAMIKSDYDISLLFQASKEELSSVYNNRAMMVSGDEKEMKRLIDMEAKKERLKSLTREELENIVLYGENYEIKRGKIR